MQKTQVQSLGLEDPLEKGTATHSGILAWRIPWTEELGGLQSTYPWDLKESNMTEQLTLSGFVNLPMPHLTYLDPFPSFSFPG